MLCPGRALPRPHGAAAASASAKLSARGQRPRCSASPSRAPRPYSHRQPPRGGKGRPFSRPRYIRDGERCTHWLRGSPFAIGCFFLHYRYRLALVRFPFPPSASLLTSNRGGTAASATRRPAAAAAPNGEAGLRRKGWGTGGRGRGGGGVVAREPMGRRTPGWAGGGSQWAGAFRAGVGRGGGPRPWRRGSHDAELLGAGLYRPRQRAEPGARHLLPPVSAAVPRGGVPGPARAWGGGQRPPSPPALSPSAPGSRWTPRSAASGSAP